MIGRSRTVICAMQKSDSVNQFYLCPRKWKNSGARYVDQQRQCTPLCVIGQYFYLCSWYSSSVSVGSYLFDFAVPMFFAISGYFLLNGKNVTRTYATNKIKSILKLVLSWNVVVLVFNVLQTKQGGFIWCSTYQ